MAKISSNSQGRNVRPSELTKGQFLEVEHAGTFYTFDHSYGLLDLIIGQKGADGTDVVAFRFIDGCGLTPQNADTIWSDLMDQFDSNKVWKNDGQQVPNDLS